MARASIIVLAVLAVLFLLAGAGILVVSSAHGHGLPSLDRDIVIVAWISALGCGMAAAMIGRS